jgi:hypothetical protein
MNFSKHTAAVSIQSLKMPCITRNGFRIYYEIGGVGEPLILAGEHGLFATKEDVAVLHAGIGSSLLKIIPDRET